MGSHNIQIGIDLGTTNSEIAVNNKGTVEINKNIYGDDYTPSVFGIDKSMNKIVGKKAYEKLFKDSSESELPNYKAEIKRLMGTSEKIRFERLNQEMTPEEISSEILKSLKSDVLRKYPSLNTNGVIITIPAYFSTLQAEATKRAGNLAGFKHVVLLQEPIAAAISFGFMSSKDETWLVYDLGGGTFDVALISSLDSSLSVLEHNGDNFLGGKDFDWLIVDKVLVPNVLRLFRLNEFNRGNHKYRTVFSKLKFIAELAKIFLSQFDKTVVEIDGIGIDDDGKEIYLTFDLTKKEFEELIKPLISKTIELCKSVICDAGLEYSSIKKVVLVGGATQIPLVKSYMENELNVQVDTSTDPFSGVAKGACIFGYSQKIPPEIMDSGKTSKNSVIKVDLHYESLTSEAEETINGIIKNIKNTTDEYFIQIQSENELFTSNKIQLKNGKFICNISVEPNKSNLFWVYLFNKDGDSLPIEPDSFTITHGISVAGVPIPHSIGVAVAKRDWKNKFELTETLEKYFNKNSILPLKDSKTFKTVKTVKKGDSENVLPIKVYEGESEIPDRNHQICDLKITGKNLPYDLPENTEVEISIEVSDSREVKVNAFIPIVDLRINARASIHAEQIKVEEMQTDLETQINRVKAMEASSKSSNSDKNKEAVQSIGSSLRNAHLDEDEKRKAHKQLKDLKKSLDEQEGEKEFSQIVKEFKEGVNALDGLLKEMENTKEKESYQDQLKAMRAEGQKAMDNNDKFLLSRVNDLVAELSVQMLLSNPATWIMQFNTIANGKHTFTDESEAIFFIKKGKKAIENSDIDELKRCVKNLMGLLPPEEQISIKSSISGITY